MLLGAVAGTIFYLGIWRWWWLIDDGKRDGLELIGPVLGSIYFALLVIPAWHLGLRNRALAFGAVLAALALVFAADSVFHWVPWQIFSGG